MLFCHEPIEDGLYPRDSLYPYLITRTRGVKHRGPTCEPSGDYIVCLGAGQTFGRFSMTPFPYLLGQAIEDPVINFGYGRLNPMDLWWSVPHRQVLLDARLIVVQSSLWRLEYLQSLEKLLSRLSRVFLLQLTHPTFITLDKADLSVEVTLREVYLDDESHVRTANALARSL